MPRLLRRTRDERPKLIRVIASGFARVDGLLALNLRDLHPIIPTRSIGKESR
jgi:hypothetical protein